MRSKDYNYMPAEEYEISDARKEELIQKVTDQVRKGFIAHYQVLAIGENDEEYDFIYQWLDDNDVTIRGINGTISSEIPNYIHIPKMGQSYTPDVLSKAEQEKLFLELNSFSEEDKKDNPKYKADREKLIESNMKLVKWITSWKGIRNLPASQEDKYQMGYIGLIKAVDKFDPSLGFKFSTYATKTISRTIIREVYREGEIRRYLEVNEQLAMIPDIENMIWLQLGREATQSEIADILGVSEEKVQELNTLRMLQEKDSLNQIVEDKGTIDVITGSISDGDRPSDYEVGAGLVLDGVYEDKTDVLPVGFKMCDKTAAAAMVEGIKGDIQQAISGLTEREQDVLILRFGLGNEEPKTLENVGKHLGVSRERIRQIEAKALRKLHYRAITRKNGLKSGLEVYENLADQEEPSFIE